jgi:IS5 family transposase
MSVQLDRLPAVIDLVREDLLAGGIKANAGREGMTAEQVLRCLIVQRMNGFTFEELSFHLADSSCYRSFCRFGFADSVPTKSTLQRNIKRLRPETLERINRLIVLSSAARAIEDGERVRADSTVSETNIHHPSDSSLLWDCVRVLTRLMHRGRKLDVVQFSDHTRRAKRRKIGIEHARSREKRAILYRDLLAVTQKTVCYAESVAAHLERLGHVRALSLATELRHYMELAHRVMDQTRRRIIHGEKVPVEDKIVSIFETHTDIIVKDRRETRYGHKLFLTTGGSGLVLDCIVGDGNPADANVAVTLIERQAELYGRSPRQAAFDGGFASKDNLAAIKNLAVEDVAFSKRRGLKVSDMVKDSWVYRKLRNFRAGIESVISFLKRSFGLARCSWRSLPSFKAYTWASILSANLLIVARSMIT